MSENILVVVKPDAVKKGLTGSVLSRLEETKLELVAAKLMRVSECLAKEHYKQLSDKPFFGELLQYIQGKLHDSPNVLALVYRGENAIQKIRALAGATNPEQAEPTSLRGAYGRITTKGMIENILHASSEPSEAEREIKLWFQPCELLEELYPTKKEACEKKEKTVWA